MTPTQWIEHLLDPMLTAFYITTESQNIKQDILPRLREELQTFRDMGFGGHELGVFRTPEGYIEIIPLCMIRR